MNKLQFIDLISKFQEPVNKIILVNKIESYVFRELQKLKQVEIEQMIYDLLKDDICQIQRFDVEDYLDVTEDALAGYNQHHHFDFDIDDVIGLTKKGGEIWEQAYSPNWQNFIDCYFEDNTYQEPIKIELTCQNKDLLEKIILPLKALNLDYHLKTIDYFEPCYWKTLENAWVFEFTANSLEEKIEIEKIYLSLSQYSPLFCEKTKAFW